jgi:hypothetical protein
MKSRPSEVHRQGVTSPTTKTTTNHNTLSIREGGEGVDSLRAMTTKVVALHRATFPHPSFLEDLLS